MPNTYITPSLIAKTALATLHHSLVLANLVWRDFDGDFTGKQGDTVTIRKPATFTAEDFVRANGVTLQTITENSTTVVLDKLANVSVAVTDEEMTLKIEDFQTQVLNGMVRAIAEKVDGDLAELLSDTANGGGGGGVSTSGATTPSVAYRSALSKLGRNKLPLSDRFAVISPEAQALILGESQLVKVNEAGTSNALRQAIIGDVFGFVNYVSGVFGSGSGDKGQTDGVAFHKESVTLAVRPLLTPKGIAPTQASQESFDGLSMRVVYDYNSNKKQDEVSVDLLYGVKALRPEGAVELEFGQGS